MRRGILVPLIFGLIGVGILVALGTWQLRRLAWKDAILTRIEARMAGEAIALPSQPDKKTDNYRKVTLSGNVMPGEVHVLTSSKTGGPGFRVISPLESDGRRILVDLGYVTEARKQAPRPDGRVEITGNLLWPDDETSYTPEPDLTRNIWFSRNVDKLAAALDTAPILVVASRTNGGDGAPEPVPVGINIPNDHLEYAITWFALALVWTAMTVGYILRRR